MKYSTTISETHKTPFRDPGGMMSRRAVQRRFTMEAPGCLSTPNLMRSKAGDARLARRQAQANCVSPPVIFHGALLRSSLFLPLIGYTGGCARVQSRPQ